MVAVVHESVGPRVRSGFLGCPSCEARFQIEEGVLHLSGEAVGGAVTPVDSRPRADASQATPHPGLAVLVAAVLGLGDGRGCVLLGPGLASIAAGLAAVAADWEVLSLTESGCSGDVEAENLSRVRIDAAAELPVLPGRFEAVAMAGDDPADRLRASTQALGPLGRLAIVGPGPGAEDVVRAAGLRILAADSRVVVASREG